MRCGIEAARSLTGRRSVFPEGLWIGDELLRTTYHHFVEPYKIPHKRDYGHVPGPLEFRKRHPKRRMASLTFSDIPNNSLPSLWPALFNIGSLFRTPPALDSQWTWEAPRTLELPLDTKFMSLGMEESAVFGDVNTELLLDPEDFEVIAEARNSFESSNYQEALLQLQSIADIRALYWKLCPIGKEAVKFSQYAFQRVLQLATDMLQNSLGRPLQLTSEFLDSDLNLATAGNLLAFAQWATQHVNEKLFSLEVAKQLINQIQQGTPSTEELCSVLDMYRIQVHARGASKAASRQISSRVRSLSRSVQSWLVLHEGYSSNDSVAASLVNTLRALPIHWAASVSMVTEIARFPLEQRQKHDETIRDHLIESLRLDMAPEKASRLDARLRKVISTFSQDHDSNLHAWWLRILLDTTQILLQQSRYEPSMANMLGHWISTLEMRAIYADDKMYHNLWASLSSMISSAESQATILSYLSQSKHKVLSPPKGLSIFRSFVEHSNLVPKVAVAQIHDCLARGDTHGALKYFDHNKSVHLSSCESLPFSMISDGCTSHRVIMRMLSRAEAHNNKKAQGCEQPPNRLSTRRVRLVENLAYHISLSDKPTHRQAFRMVWALYQYLRGNRTKLSPTMSRALLRAGATRFLRDQQVVPRERFAWILSIVAEVEGRDIADHLDTVAGRWMNSVWDKKEASNTPGRSGVPEKQSILKEGRPWHLAKRPASKRQVSGRKLSLRRTRDMSRSRGHGERADSIETYRIRGIASPYISSEQWVRPLQIHEDDSVVRTALSDDTESTSPQR